MRLLYCLLLALSACTSHVVRCDGRLQPINVPAAGAAAGSATPATRGPASPRSAP
jgi:hypothetical protein